MRVSTSLAGWPGFSTLLHPHTVCAPSFAFLRRAGQGNGGGWPSLNFIETLEGAPSKLRLGGGFVVIS
jgi:hypothetical protein